MLELVRLYGTGGRRVGQGQAKVYTTCLMGKGYRWGGPVRASLRDHFTSRAPYGLRISPIWTEQAGFFYSFFPEAYAGMHVKRRLDWRLRAAA